jgi:molybdate transport system ATP-binding protein
MRRMKKSRRARDERYLEVELARVDLVRGGRRVLRNLSWRIRPGQRWVLQGANGAGKTQLLKLIAGDVWPQPRKDTRRRYRWRGHWHSEPYEVKESISYVGAERQDRYQHYDWNHRVSTIVGTGLIRADTPERALRRPERERVARLLRRFGIEGLARRRFLTLSQGERRLVLLARALAWRPALLLLDEPLNGLDADYRARILAALATLRHSRLPWVYASHRREEVPASATHFAVLRDGRVRSGRAFRLPGPGRRASPRARTRRATAASLPPVLMALRNASVWRGGRVVLRRLNFEIRAGECWVVHGANGSGKSTLLATLFGEHGVARDGSIWRRNHSPGEALSDYQQRVGHIAPELQAALPRAQLALDCVIAGARGAFRLDGAGSGVERRRALRALAEVGAARFARRAFGELSYGQARRIVFARALVREPDMVLLDEPYTGLDAGTSRRLRSRVDSLIARGRTVVVVSHHRDDWPSGATHELELDGGVARYSGRRRRP